MQLKALLKDILEKETLIRIKLSRPLTSKTDYQQAIIRPILIRTQKMYQFNYLLENKSLDENLNEDLFLQKFLSLLETAFKRAVIFTETADYHIKNDRKGEPHIQKQKPTQMKETLLHNRTKNYCLKEGKPIPFLIELGIMNKEGKVLTQKYHKFKQINRFLEMVRDILPALNTEKPIHIIDFGCGKSYLSFALYHYLVIELKLPVSITGVDIKKDVIQNCQTLAGQLNFEHLGFSVNSIENFQTTKTVDMVVALHACDIASDLALEKAIHWQAKVIMLAACCQKELFNQIENPLLAPLLKHGIMKERFSALLTDALRAQILEIMGYKTQILEFIELEHTAKNLLIRAIRPEASQFKKNDDDWESFQALKHSFKARPFLERVLPKEP